jgi:hexosaminidase
MHRSRWLLVAVVLIVVIGLVAWLVGTSRGEKHQAGAFPNVIVPVPVSAVASGGKPFVIDGATTIVTDTPAVSDYLATILRTSTGFELKTAANATHNSIVLSLAGAPTSVGAQGYRLIINDGGVSVHAKTPAGLFAGVQTLLQLLPPAVMASTRQSVTWSVPSGTITDYPRFAYRGAMLDVARHFFTVAQVKRFIDEMALYKINYLHLHLTDDQGWRIAIKQWPNLATHGGSTQVDGTPAGYYTQDDYVDIVKYAAAHFITVVPEVDMPGHTNAALASYADLNCDGKAPALYTDTNVGFSSLCVGKETTYSFVDDVVAELAALTPGPYIHIGGDESQATKPEDYANFVERVQKIVLDHGKTAMGWHDIADANLQPSTVAEYWAPDLSSGTLATRAATGTKVILAPANHAYLDMKYDDGTKIGQTWAGTTDVNAAYGWNPGAYLPGIGESSVLGVEACLWTETIRIPSEIDYMMFPRLPAIAELGWSPWSTHDETEFDARLAAQGPRWTAMGINFYRSSEVAWSARS